MSYAFGKSLSSALCFVSAGVIFALVAYEAAMELSPLIKRKHPELSSALLILLPLLVLKVGALFVFRGFGFDVFHYLSWAIRLAAVGPAWFYERGHLLPITPGYLYVLWIPGILSRHLPGGGRVLVELPPIFADFLLGLVVLAYVESRGKPARGVLAAGLVALNPAMLFNTVVWGQNDSVLALIIWLSIVATLSSRYEVAGGLMAFSFLIDPEAAVIAPLLGLWTLSKADARTVGRFALAAIGILIVGVAPFQLGHSLSWIPAIAGESIRAYRRETPVYPFNFSALVMGLTSADTMTVAGIPYLSLAWIFPLAVCVIAGWVVWRNRTHDSLLKACCLALLGFFVFAPTAYPHHICSAIACASVPAIESHEMLVLWTILTATGLFNLAYLKTMVGSGLQLSLSGRSAMVCGVLNLAGFGIATHSVVASRRRPRLLKSANNALSDG